MRKEPTVDPGAVVHVALGGQLAHPGVDQRVAGAAFAPGLEDSLRARPAVAARAVVAPRQGRERGQHLVVEVAPAELPHEGLAAARLARLDGELERADAAPADVGAEPGGAVARRGRRGRLRSADSVAEEGAHALAGLRLAARLAVRGRRAVGQLAERRQLARGEARRHAQLARRAEPLAPGRRAPGAVVGTEDLEVVAAGGGHRAGLEDRHAGVGGELDPASSQACRSRLSRRRA